MHAMDLTMVWEGGRWALFGTLLSLKRITEKNKNTEKVRLREQSRTSNQKLYEFCATNATWQGWEKHNYCKICVRRTYSRSNVIKTQDETEYIFNIVLSKKQVSHPPLHPSHTIPPPPKEAKPPKRSKPPLPYPPGFWTKRGGTIGWHNRKIWLKNDRSLSSFSLGRSWKIKNYDLFALVYRWQKKTANEGLLTRRTLISQLKVFYHRKTQTSCFFSPKPK